MALKDKIKGKRDLGLVVNRHRELHDSMPKGAYNLLIDAAGTGVIGRITGLTAGANGLYNPSSPAAVTGGMNWLTGSAFDNGINLTTTSFVFAWSYKFLAALTGNTVNFTDGVNPKIGLNHAASTGAHSFKNYNSAGAATDFYTGTNFILSAADTNSHTVVEAYDAIAKRFVAYKDGVKLVDATSTIAAPAVGNMRTLSMTANAALCNLHMMAFPNAGLPVDLAALVAAYQASPSVKLAAWAD